MERVDSISKLDISLRSARRRTLAPRMVAAGRDHQNAAHGRDGEIGLVRLHESERLRGIASVSRANQAAAFFKISRSMRSCLFSRRNLASSHVLRDRQPTVSALVDTIVLAPVAHGLLREIELASHIQYTAAGTNQFDNLLPIIERITG